MNVYVCVYVHVNVSVHVYIYGSGSKPRVCNKAGAHTRDIPRYKGYVTGRRLSRQHPPLA